MQGTAAEKLALFEKVKVRGEVWPVLIARNVGLSKNTVMDIVGRNNSES